MTPAPSRLRGLQVALLAGCASLYVGVVAAGWPDLVFALALEGAPLGWLQSMALVACASAAALVAAQASAGRAAWGALALLLLAAALDERFMWHERVQDALAAALGDNEEHRRAAQTLTLAYVPIGLAVATWLRRELDPRAWPWACGAAAIGIVALLLDATFVAAAPQVVEETFEFAAESAMLVALFSEAHIRACRTR